MKKYIKTSKLDAETNDRFSSLENSIKSSIDEAWEFFRYAREDNVAVADQVKNIANDLASINERLRNIRSYLNTW